MDRLVTRIYVLGSLLLVIGITGCGDTKTDAPATSISSNQQTAKSATEQQPIAQKPLPPLPSAETPQGAVAAFLEVVRRGDKLQARAMLTPLALQKTEEYKLTFAPEGSDTATFQVKSEKVQADGTANVESTWTDLDEEDNPREENITWTVKRLGNVWKISGMIAHLGPDQPPIVINFEKPDELLRRQEQTAEAQQVAPAANTPALQDSPVQDGPVERQATRPTETAPRR